MDEARLYTLRVWQHDHAFRAVLRAVGEEHAEHFTEPAAVAAYLHWASGAGTPPQPAPAGAAARAADAAGTNPPRVDVAALAPRNAGETPAAEHGDVPAPTSHTRSAS